MGRRGVGGWVEQLGGARERLALVAVKVADRSLGGRRAKGTTWLPRWETGKSLTVKVTTVLELSVQTRPVGGATAVTNMDQ